MPKISSLTLQEIDYYIYKYQLQLSQMPGNQALERILTSLYIRKKQLIEENTKKQSEDLLGSASNFKFTKPTISNNTIPTRSSNHANYATAPTRSSNHAKHTTVPDQSLKFQLRPAQNKTQAVAPAPGPTPTTEMVNAKATDPSFRPFEYKNLQNEDAQSGETDEHPVHIDVDEYLVDEPEKNPTEMTSEHESSSLLPLESPPEKTPETEKEQDVPSPSTENIEGLPQADQEIEEEVIVSTPKSENKFANSPYKMAPLMERAKATTIDYCLMVIGFWISNTVPKEMGLFLQSILNTDLFIKNPLPLNVIWFFGIVAIYYLVLMKDGQSYGKKIIGLKIINDNDELILTKETIMRRELLGKSASILMGFYGFYQAFQDKSNQLTFHDKFSHTRVITFPKK